LLAYTLCKMDVVLSALADEVTLAFSVESSPSTSWTVWEAALASLTCAAEAEFFKSPSTGAKADWAQDRSPELRTMLTQC
jgi:hypothetical protein